MIRAERLSRSEEEGTRLSERASKLLYASPVERTSKQASESGSGQNVQT